MSSYKESNLPLRVPDLDSSDPDLIAFKERFFNYLSAFRNSHMSNMAQNFHYVLGNQWIEPDSDLIIDGVRGYVFRDIVSNTDNQMPRPVTNYIAPSVEVEMASLGKRQLTPKVITTSKDPRIEAAAKVAQEILDARLRKMNWQAIREQATLYSIVCGTTCVRSFWDETYNDLTLIGSPMAAMCPQCGKKLASRRIPTGLNEMVTANSETMREVSPDSPDYESELELGYCPTCPGSQLIDHSPGIDEAQNTDYFSRPMGMLVPKGNTAMEIVTPFELFPENGGVGVYPESCKTWGQATARDLDWIESRYPDKCGDIEPEDPQELMKQHPILGEWGYLGRYDPTMDSGIYENHARVYELHVDPCYRFPKGRSLVWAGDTILENGELVRQITAPEGTISVPRVKYAGSQFKLRPMSFWGQSLVDDLISPQNRLNGMDAQIIDARERMGSPHILVTEAMDLSSPEWFSDYGSGKIMRYQLDPLNISAKPELFGDKIFDQGVYQERDRILTDMKTIAGPQDIEIGEAPRNISTTSGLQLIGEAAERRRSSRERALTEMFETLWSHTLQLLWTLRIETDDYEVQNPEGTWETKQFDRTKIKGQYKVKVEKQAYIDHSLYQKEATREAQADGLYDLSTQLARKKILEYRGLPTDVNEDLNYQSDRAKEQWTDFVDEGKIPTIDTTLDDPTIRSQALMTMLLTDEGKQLADSVGWGKVAKLITGWEEELAQAEMLDAQAKAFYGGRIPPGPQADAAYQQAQAIYGQQMQAYRAQAATPQVDPATGQPMPAPMPPSPPPPPVFLPPAKEDRILGIWTQRLNEAAMMGQGLPEPEGFDEPVAFQAKLQSFLQFRAVVDAYKVLSDQKLAAMGMPGIAPPGTPGGNPGIGGATPGLDFASPPNPPNPPPVPGF